MATSTPYAVVLIRAGDLKVGATVLAQGMFPQTIDSITTVGAGSSGNCVFTCERSPGYKKYRFTFSAKSDSIVAVLSSISGEFSCKTHVMY